MCERIDVLAKYWVAIVATAEPTETVLDGWVVKKQLVPQPRMCLVYFTRNRYKHSYSM